MKTPIIIRLEYTGIGPDAGRKYKWRVWREPRVHGRRFDANLKKWVGDTGPQWAFEDSEGYVRYIGETWAVAVQRLHGYVESYGMKLLQQLS